MVATLRRFWKNEWFHAAVVILLIAGVVLGLWYGSQAVLGTKITPGLAVVSGSMCIPYGGACDDWLSVNHPFDRTLHKGDIIIIQGINPADLNANYPNSDVIVFQSPLNPNELIVHRIIAKTEVNGTIYFSTKGDGNGNPWPQPPASSLDPWDYNNPAGVPQDFVYGKVVMCIPWIGWLPIKVQEMGANNSLIVPILPNYYTAHNS